MNSLDTLQPFIFEHANIRGGIVRLDQTFKTIISQHPYPPMIKQFLGEAITSSLLVAGSIKFEGEISLQFHGDKRLPLLIVQCNHQLQVRAFAKFQENAADLDYQKSFLAGEMLLTINQYKQTQAYQSIVPIRSFSMSENLMSYFEQSEQIKSHVWLAVNDDKAAGMLLQLMPEEDHTQHEQLWEYAIHIGQTLDKKELLTLDNHTLLHRLYHETELRLYNARNIEFSCRCNVEKMKQVLTILGQDDLEKLFDERGKIEINCDFCNHNYIFDAIEIGSFFS
ncbi:MAG: Hsp33 family molecular chaperone HslO [Legionella sp.]